MSEDYTPFDHPRRVPAYSIPEVDRLLNDVLDLALLRHTPVQELPVLWWRIRDAAYRLGQRAGCREEPPVRDE